MTEADIPAVSAIRVGGWQAAYSGIVPQSFLDRMSVAEDVRRRKRRFEDPGRGVIDLVADDAEGQVVGWACLGPCRDDEPPPRTGELYALYVRPARRRTGIGRTLLTAVHRRAPAAGFTALRLWTLTANAPTRRFYELAGWTPDGATQSHDYDGVPVTEVRYRREVAAGGAGA